MPIRKLFILATVPCLTACAAVTPVDNADTVSVIKPEQTAECRKMATTNVGVTTEVGIYTRSDETIEKDLVTLGKNRAVEIGGDSIVAKGPAKDGKMSFDIYKCGN